MLRHCSRGRKMMTDWSTAPYVFLFVPEPPPIVCPFCRLAGTPIYVRSEKNGDGSVTRLSVCRGCSERFKLVVETAPATGKVDDAFDYDFNS